MPVVNLGGGNSKPTNKFWLGFFLNKKGSESDVVIVEHIFFPECECYRMVFLKLFYLLNVPEIWPVLVISHTF